MMVYLPALADHDFGLEGKPSRDFSTQLRPVHALPDHESPRGPDIDGIEVPQLFGEPGSRKVL